MLTVEDIRKGSIVLVRPVFGTAPAIKVAVELVEEDIKNGLPGICYEGRWAYLHQVDRVIAY